MTAAPFCAICGAAFEADDQYCANCGAARPTVRPATVSTPTPPPVPASPPRGRTEHPVASESRSFWSSKAGGWTAVVVLAVIGVLIAARAFGGSDPQRHQLFGSMLLLDPSQFEVTGAGCSGRGVAADMVPGAQVTIRDGDGDVLATDTLEQGFVTPEGNCRLRYGVEVPKADRYSFAIGHYVDPRVVTPATLAVAATNAGLTGGDWWITHSL